MAFFLSQYFPIALRIDIDRCSKDDSVASGKYARSKLVEENVHVVIGSSSTLSSSC